MFCVFALVHSSKFSYARNRVGAHIQLTREEVEQPQNYDELLHETEALRLREERLRSLEQECAISPTRMARPYPLD